MTIFSTTQHLRVLVIADDPLAGAGLATLLETHPSCTVVGQVDSNVDLLAEVDLYQPDVLVWDLGWEPVTGLRRLDDVSQVELAMVALLPDETHLGGAWSAGFQGILLRDANADKLWATLQASLQGLMVLDPALAKALRPDRPIDLPQLVETPTPRELEVLQLLAEGLSNKAIALELGISEHTVKFHVNALLGKLNAQSRTEAVVTATRLGLLLL